MSANNDIKDKSNKTDQLLNSKNVAIDYNKIIKNLQPMIEMSEIMTLKINDYLSVFIDSFNSLKISDTLYDITKDLYEAIRKIDFNVTEERKVELLNIYKEWGKYGWSTIPYAQFDLYNTFPKDIQDANKLLLPYINKENLDKLFIELEGSCSNKNDLSEAIFCYRNKKYMACSLILFALIDNLLIDIQNKPGRNKKLFNGCRAISKIREQINHDIDCSIIELISYLNFMNIFSCLFTIFADTNDFTCKGLVINRNCLCHGMNKRKVLQRECKQLFILLHNVNNFIKPITIKY